MQSDYWQLIHKMVTCFFFLRMTIAVGEKRNRIICVICVIIFWRNWLRFGTLRHSGDFRRVFRFVSFFVNLLQNDSFAVCASSHPSASSLYSENGSLGADTCTCVPFPSINIGGDEKDRKRWKKKRRMKDTDIQSGSEVCVRPRRGRVSRVSDALLVFIACGCFAAADSKSWFQVKGLTTQRCQLLRLPTRPLSFCSLHRHSETSLFFPSSFSL